MTEIKYKIERWDPIVMGNTLSVDPIPIIYIKADDKLIEFAKQTEGYILVTISGTNTIYDGKNLRGKLSSSAVVPNYRPIFFEKTGLYVIALEAYWYGYPSPKELGEVTIYIDNDKKETLLSQPNIQPPCESSYLGYDRIELILIGCELLIVLCVSFLILRIWKSRRNINIKKFIN